MDVSLNAMHKIGDTVVYFYDGMVQSGEIWHIEYLLNDDGSSLIEHAINVEMNGSGGAITHFVPIEDIIIDSYFSNINDLFNL